MSRFQYSSLLDRSWFFDSVRRTLATGLLLFAALTVRADSVVVFNEIMYHPATNEPALEWIELHNQNAVDVDLTAWRLTGGIEYEFPPGTIIAGRGYWVVSIAPSHLSRTAGITNVSGPFRDRLANDGEELRLRDNNDRVMDSVDYGVADDWPPGADGGGVSLAKRHSDLASAPPENWTVSSEMGGTPGAVNFPSEPSAESKPAILFNEISPDAPANTWVEIVNVGDEPVELAGHEIVRGGNSTPFVLPSRPLASGGFSAIFQLPFSGQVGDKLFLYTPQRTRLLDTVAFSSTSRGRWPDGAGEWLVPTTLTPGAANIVKLRNEIVINEIMYHPPPYDPAPAVTSNSVITAFDGVWRFHDGGVDLGESWRGSDFNDTSWSSGSGLLTFNTGALPTSPRTTLQSGRATYYFRTSFNFSGATTNVTLDVRPVIDDGAVFYLNGTEIARHNLPPGQILYDTPALRPIGDAGITASIAIPASQLVQGRNVLAVEVHQATEATDASGLVLTGGGLALVEEGPPGEVPMNLARQPGSAPFVINSLSGYAIHNYLGLTDGVYGNNNSWIGNSGAPAYAAVRFASLSSVHSLAFGRDNTGTYTDRTLGLYTLQYTRVASPGTATTVTDDPETGWAAIGTINYQRVGTGLFANPSRRHRFTFTPVQATAIRLLVPGAGLSSGTCLDELEVNPPDTLGDVAFGAELSLTTTIAPATPFGESDEEWIELFNRSTNAVDLTGWSLDGAIDFRFTNGPVVPAGGFIVVARESAAMRQIWPERANRIFGDFSGRLRPGERLRLRDPIGNPGDDARIFEIGWSDGGGSSIELRDVEADHANPGSWADSDESAKTGWQTINYRMVAGQNYGPTRWNEFRVGLLDQGIVLLDDVSVLRDPAGARQELIQNGNFEITTGNTRWRFLGHHRGEFIPDPDNPTNHVVRITAGGRMVMNHNHVETTFLSNSPIVNGQIYEVSFRARWVAGSPQLNTRAYFSKLARTTLLPIPRRLGTPAAPNSRAIANAGPTFAELRHSPVLPATNQPVTISVRASDPDQVASALLHYRVNPAATFETLPMRLETNGLWAAAIPEQAAGRIVQFYILATDSLGAAAFAPPKGPESRALYQVADNQRSTVPAHELRLIMLDADRNLMFAPTNVMSNARNGGTLIYNRSQVFYDAGVRLQGTVASRIRDGDQYISYDIALPPGQLFRGVQDNIGIDRSGRAPTVRSQDEIYVFHMFHRAGVPVPYHDLCYFIAPRIVHTGTAILQLAGYGPRFIEEQYGKPGNVFNMDVTYEPDTTLSAANPESVKLPIPHQAHIGTDFTDLGDLEQYRSPFDLRYDNRRDDYSGLMRLCRAMGLPQAEFNQQIPGVLDVNQVLRMTALEILCGIQDTYISPVSSFPHNLRLITFPDGSPAQFLAWDMDFVFGLPSNSPIYPHSGINLGKLVSYPPTRRLYLHHVYDLCQTAFNTNYMNRWFAHYGSVVGRNFNGAASYVNSRRAYALSQLPRAVPFEITSNAGQNFASDTNIVTLTGAAWLDLRELEVNGVPRPLTWTSPTNWTLTVPLAPGVNVLNLQLVDASGQRPTNRQASITVTNRAPAALLPVVINEWMANNRGPNGLANPADGLFHDWFELYNPNSLDVPLRGYFLTDDLANPKKFPVPDSAMIRARGFLLVWADENPQRNSPTNTDLHASFRLDNDGESLGLFGPDGSTPQHTISFGVQAPNISEGFFPDGALTGRLFMTNASPRAPNLGPDAPKITAISLLAGSLRLSVAAIPQRSYRLEFKDRLSDPAWTPLDPAWIASSQTLSIELTNSPAPQRFFRIRLE